MDIKAFLASPAFAVAGASKDRNKFGNKILRCYLQHHKIVYPINPKEKIIEDLTCVSHIADLPADVQSLSIVTPPAITLDIARQAVSKGIQNIWMQPGAENEDAINICHEHNINIIAHGPCLLRVLGFIEENESDS